MFRDASCHFVDRADLGADASITQLITVEAIYSGDPVIKPVKRWEHRLTAQRTMLLIAVGNTQETRHLVNNEADPERGDDGQQNNLRQEGEWLRRISCAQALDDWPQEKDEYQSEDPHCAK